MVETITYSQIGSKSFRVRQWMSKDNSNETLVVGSSLLKDINNQRYDCVSIAGARVQDIAEYLKMMDEKIENYIKVCLLLGGNNLHDWKADIVESTLTVSLSKFSLFSMFEHDD